MIDLAKCVLCKEQLLTVENFPLPALFLLCIAGLPNWCFLRSAEYLPWGLFIFTMLRWVSLPPNVLAPDTVCHLHLRHGSCCPKRLEERAAMWNEGFLVWSELCVAVVDFDCPALVGTGEDLLVWTQRWVLESFLDRRLCTTWLLPQVLCNIFLFHAETSL